MLKWVIKNLRTLYCIFRVINNNGGSPPLTYMLFNQVAQLLGDPPRPASDPDFSDIRLPVAEDHDNKYGIRSLEKMGKRILLFLHMFSTSHCTA